MTVTTISVDLGHRQESYRIHLRSIFGDPGVRVVREGDGITSMANTGISTATVQDTATIITSITTSDHDHVHRRMDLGMAPVHPRDILHSRDIMDQAQALLSPESTACAGSVSLVITLRRLPHTTTDAVATIFPLITTVLSATHLRIHLLRTSSGRPLHLKEVRYDRLPSLASEVPMVVITPTGTLPGPGEEPRLDQGFQTGVKNFPASSLLTAVDE